MKHSFLIAICAALTAPSLCAMPLGHSEYEIMGHDLEFLLMSESIHPWIRERIFAKDEHIHLLCVPGTDAGDALTELASVCKRNPINRRYVQWVGTVSEKDKALCDAIIQENVVAVGLWLRAGANPNTRDADGNPLLLVATNWGNQSIIHSLAWHGANMFAQNSAGETALHRAVLLNNNESLASLLDLGGKNGCIHIQDGKGRTPLDIARVQGNNGAVEVLKSYWAKSGEQLRKEGFYPGHGYVSLPEAD